MNITTARRPLQALKSKQQIAWGSGDYSRIGVTLQLTGELLAEALRLPAGARVLDVAAGNGNATLACARRGQDVVSTDWVESLLESGRRRAEAEGLEVEHRVADAEDLPFGDGEFDAVVSTFGVMFTPHQETAAAELQRVVRSGGRVGLVNWTPESFIGRLFGVLGRHLPPPAGAQSPARWGRREWIEEQFGERMEVSAFRTRHFDFVYRSAEEFLEVFRTWYGPMQRAFAALDEAGGEALAADILELARQFDVASDGGLRVPSEYAEIVLTAR